MSENNVNGIIGASVTTTGIIGATVAIGQYIINDYVITIAEAEGDYGYTMTITRGTDTQTVTLYGLTPEQYNAMLGYLEAAQSAAESAGESETAAREFERVAGISASSASSAKNAAQSAASNARSAASDAASAKNDAVTAKNAAEAAATRAETAATRAETAAGEITGMTVEAETLEPGSPATASFLDGVLSLGIPAGANGAAGNGIVSIVKSGTSGNIDTYTITYTNGTTSTFTVRNGVDGAVTSVAGKTGAVTLNAGDVAFDDQQAYDDGTVGAGLTDLKSQMSVVDSMALGAYPTDTVSGAVASFSDGGDNLPVKDLTISIEPVQSGSGVPSPDNVRPISGWTGAQISVNEDTIAVTFHAEAGTVYGGMLDVTTGVLTVDRAIKTYTGVENWASYYGYNGFSVYNDDMRTGMRQFGIANYLKYDVGTHNKYGLWLSVNNHIVYAVEVADLLSEYTVNAWKAYLSEHPLQIVYPLATSQTYQLTPVEVLTLLGANTIYADTGDTTVTYRADPTLYADKRSTATRSIIAGIEPTMTASKAYTTGQLLIVGDTLYKVAASIASGATLTPGTNVNPTTVAEQLLLLANT